MSKARDIADLNVTILDSVESGATADQTNAEIRAAVEAATDSNVFTDADHTKLNSTVATVAGNETLTNKTLTAPTINGGTHTAFTSTGIDDNATSTAITIDSSENVTFSGTLNGISTTKSASGNRWGVLPEVESNGVMEVGRYLDFHATDGDTSDYGARLDFNGTDIVSTNAFQMSSGIYLGGTGAANKLDDYEEGTWSPVLQAYSGTQPTFTHASGYTPTGVYTKVGRLVTVEFYLPNFSVSGTTSGTLVIAGLPFTAGSAGSYNGPPVSAYNVNWARSGNVTLRHYSGTRLGFLSNNNGQTWNWEIVSAINNSVTYIVGSITYATHA